MSELASVIARSKWEVDTPFLAVDLAVMEQNIARMASTFKKAGVSWRPHTKGQKIPAIAHRLLDAGAIGVTCAKLGEAEVMAAAGIRDILIANQIVGEEKARRFMRLQRQSDVVCCVDSEVNVEQLDRAAREAGVRPRILVEVNTGMNRCGVQPGEAALGLARKVHACDGLRFAGVEGWEGHTAGIKDINEKQAAIQKAVGSLVESARLCRDAGLPASIVSCGGTGTYWITAGLPGVTEVQAGGGIFCDAHYRKDFGVEHPYALTIMTTVISRPTPTRLVCDAGRKTMSWDAGMPEPLRVDYASVRLSAEHGAVELKQPSETPRVGDKLEWIAGYGDTTVFLHDEMVGTRDDVVEVVWPIQGRGKLR